MVVIITVYGKVSVLPPLSKCMVRVFLDKKTDRFFSGLFTSWLFYTTIAFEAPKQ
jgi:hypothetical protein